MTKFREAPRGAVASFMKKLTIPKPILVIEDSRSLSYLLKTKLENSFKCEVHIAASYKEAKALLKEHRQNYHLAISDLNLPDAPEGEIIDLLNRANVKSIIITGSFGEELREMMTDKGVIDYILKDSINSYSYTVELAGRLYRNYEIKILIVDDSTSFRALMTHMLEIRNFQVSVASNGNEALQVLKDNPDIRLLITDYRMPDMDGFMLTVEARKTYERSQLAIIGMSAQGNNDLGVQFIKNGANDFLLKPFSHEELICRIDQNVDILDHIDTISDLANRDYLTNLFNRRYFFTEGPQRLNSAIESAKKTAIAMLDIDHFKNINDSYGHDVGDEVLIYFSSLLLKHFSNHLVARVGGEEFVVFMTNLGNSDVTLKLEEFRAAMELAVVVCGEHSISITASIGYNCTTNNSIDTMLKTADENLYIAKTTGRNRIEG